MEMRGSGNSACYGFSSAPGNGTPKQKRLAKPAISLVLR